MNTNNEGNQNIQLTAKTDDIALEDDDRFNLKFVHTRGSEIFDVVGNMGEYLRDTAVVKIDDDNCKYNYNKPLTICNRTLSIKMIYSTSTALQVAVNVPDEVPENTGIVAAIVQISLTEIPFNISFITESYPPIPDDYSRATGKMCTFH